MEVISIVLLTKNKKLTKISRVSFLLTFGMFILGCKSYKNEDKTLKETISPLKVISLPYNASRDLLSNPQCVYIHNKTTYLYKINPKNIVINVYELKETCVLKDSIFIPKFLQKINPRFSVISQDSILFYDKYGFYGTYLLHNKTNKIDTLHFPIHPDFAQDKSFSFYLNTTSDNMPYFDYPYLYIRTSIWKDKKRNEKGLLLKYDITQQKGIYFVDYPNISPYLENKNQYPPYIYNGIENNFNFIFSRNKIIGFYQIFDTLYVYDAHTCTLIEKKKVPSQYVTLPPRKLQKNEQGYFYATEIPSYKRLLYDKYRNVFYLTVKHKMNLEISTNQGDETFSIIVMDKNLNVIKEWFFEGKKYDYNNILILPDGVYISNSHNYISKNEKQTFSGFNLLHNVNFSN